MMSNECTEESFLRVVEDHTMKVVKDDGIHRHLVFSNGGSFNGKFELITWNGALCIYGDYGTYLFSRTDDMFKFFRTGLEYRSEHPEIQLFINPSYWGEKLQSISTYEGYKKFSSDKFIERVTEYFDTYTDDDDITKEEADELWESIEDTVLFDTSVEAFAYSAASEFEHGDFRFTDFFDGGGCEEYTYHYIWCLFAIVWGIDQYDTLAATCQSIEE